MGTLTVNVITLGCKVNRCESGSIITTLREHGFNASEGLEPADVYVLNTCSVTAEADKKSRQYLAKMRKLNPDCRIIVVGCSSQNDREKFLQSNVFAVGGTRNKSEFVLNCFAELKNKPKTDKYSIISDIILYDNFDKSKGTYSYCYESYPSNSSTRAFIKIQDGCDRFCTYCIIPYLRGRSRSRSIDDIVSECEWIESREIVLTGIDMSAYGKDIGRTFSELIRAMSGFDARKRIGSLECEVVDDELLSAMSEGNFCPHFHLSLQSGNNAVLRSMNRKYDCDFYYGKVELIRKYFPTAGITTDIIVGFPTETQEYFDESCAFIEKCAFSDIHVFPYSSRAGTLAAKKYKTLPPDTVKERVAKLLEIKKTLHDRFIADNIGSIATVYTEDLENGYNVGYTPNYIKVYSSAPCGEITTLKLTEPFADGLLGVPI